MRSRTPIYYDEENNIRPYEIPITCEICGDIRAKSKMHFSANQTHEIIGICEKCWNKEPKR